MAKGNDGRARSAGAPGAPAVAFELALLELMPLLHVWARRRAGTPDAANDLLQDTLLRALQSRDGYSDGTNLRAWLFMIMRNLAVDEGRRRSRRGPHVSIDQTPLPLGVGPRQDSELGLRDLRRALSHLQEQQQELLLRVATGGENYQELAEAYGIAVGTVKSRVARARAQLRRSLGSGTAADGEAPADAQPTLEAEVPAVPPAAPERSDGAAVPSRLVARSSQQQTTAGAASSQTIRPEDPEDV